MARWFVCVEHLIITESGERIVVERVWSELSESFQTRNLLFFRVKLSRRERTEEKKYIKMCFDIFIISKKKKEMLEHSKEEEK